MYSSFVRNIAITSLLVLLYIPLQAIPCNIDSKSEMECRVMHKHLPNELTIYEQKLKCGTAALCFPENISQPRRIKKILIDPGHGGKDPGCHGSDSKEKEIVLKIALELGQKIESQYPEIQVIYTRKTDVFIPLYRRAEIANENDVDVFISIHCNSVGASYVHGSETYVMGLHTAEEQLEVAKRENSVIRLEDEYEKQYEGYNPDSPQGHILLSVYQNAFLEQSVTLAQLIEQAFTESGKRHSRGVKQAGFLVLRSTTMPAVLVETGFLTNHNDEEFLLSESGREKVAGELLRAISKYMDIYSEPSKSNLIAKTHSPETTHNREQYSVQLMASNKSHGPRNEILELSEEIYTVESEKYIKYLSGPYENRNIAESKLDFYKSMGYEGAYLITHKNVKSPENSKK